MSLATIISNSFGNFYRQLTKNYVNNLTSTSDNLPLAASQGKALNDKIEKLVPIGYVFVWRDAQLSTMTSSSYTTLAGAPDLKTAQGVHDYFGFGTWEQIGNTFLYATDKPTAAGGNSTVTLKTENLPSHTHGIPALGGTALSNGSHNHRVWYSNDATTTTDGKGSARMRSNGSESTGASGNSPIVEAGLHTHSVITNASTSDSTGAGSPVNIIPPYKTVYMWQRIA